MQRKVSLLSSQIDACPFLFLLDQEKGIIFEPFRCQSTVVKKVEQQGESSYSVKMSLQISSLKMGDIISDERVSG